MANNIIKRVWNQNRMVNIEDLTGAAFQAENGGHTFEISGVDDAGASVALSGTVAGVFRRPDNADIALTGTAADGVVSVTLTEDCYAVPGRFSLAIFVTSNSQKVAVYACVGTVASTSGGAVAGDTPQDVVDLINAINAAISSIPPTYTDLMAAIAPTYSSSALYAVGSYAWYDGNLYRCTSVITTAESWTAAHWTLADLAGDVADLKNAFTNDLDSIFGVKIVSLNTVKGKYYNLNGESVDLSNPTTLADYESFYYPCSSGDLFVFNCIGQTAARAYAFASSNGTILKRANAGAILNNYADTAPENSAYVIVNNQLAANNPVECLVYRFNPKYFTNNNKIVPNIKNGDDLNNYIVSGNYLITRSASYDDIGNMPANMPGKLIVIENDTGVVVQWYISDEGYFYLRRKISSWGNWERVSFNSEFSETAILSAKNTTDIPAEADLNDYVYAGNYKVASDSVASQVNNIPVQRNGKLFVLAANNYIIQIYISSYGEMYIRSKILYTSWRSWQHVAFESLAKYVAFSMENGVAPIQSNSDLNDYTTSGNYYISDGVKSTISNLPADVPGILVVGVPASYYRVQWYISCYGYFYLRSKYSTSSWSKWVRLATIDDINESSQVSYGRRNAIASANQMLNIKWTPIRPIPATNSAGYVGAGVECTGLPYSSTRSVCKYIGQHLTFYTFMSALQNPRSVLYTRRIKYGDLGKSYYGITCFTFTSYASGSKLGMFDNEITRMTDGTDVEISPYQIEIGDTLELIYDRETLPDPYDTTKQQPAQHTLLVYNSTKDSQGRITSVTLAQASPPFATKSSMPFSVFLSTYVYGGLKYKVYKMDKRLDYGSYEKNNQVKGYSDEVLIPDVFPDIMPEYGDRACVEAGTDVVINIINSRTYNAIKIYKDNVLIDTKTTIEDFTMSGIDYGTYRFEITDGTNSSESTLIVADVQGTYNEQTKQITFSSQNATPVFAASYITGSPLKGVQNKVKYFTAEEIENGSADVSGIVGDYYDAVQIGFKTEYGVAMWWSQRLTDEWEYWTPPAT